MAYHIENDGTIFVSANPMKVAALIGKTIEGTCENCGISLQVDGSVIRLRGENVCGKLALRTFLEREIRKFHCGFSISTFDLKTKEDNSPDYLSYSINPITFTFY